MASEDAFGSYIARGASRPICKSVYESGPDSIKPQIHLWPSFEKLSGSEGICECRNNFLFKKILT
jgi:hypothetical protein